MKGQQRWQRARDAAGRSLGVFCRDVGYGLLEVSHNTLALLGLTVVTVAVFAIGQPELRGSVEQKAFGWLLARQEAKQEARVDVPEPSILMTLSEPDAIARATAVNPKDLTRQQASVAQWISRRYRVAPEPVSRLVQEAWSVGSKAGLDPTLILAIMAVESSFNPFAQSNVGAQGLMQVMTRMHDDKYEAFGGTFAAFDPVSNLRVGVQVLKECISRAGGLEAGLRYYVGAANLDTDGGYTSRVLAEQYRMRQVASGRSVPITTPISTVAGTPIAPPAAPKQAAPAAAPAATSEGPSAMAPAEAAPTAQQIALWR